MAIVNFNGALRLYLLGDGKIVSMISTYIYNKIPPQDAAMPCLVVQKIGKEERLKTTTALSGIVTERWQTEAYSDDLDEAEELAKAVCDRLDLKYNENWNGYKIYLSEWENENDLSDEITKGSGKIKYRIQQDFMIKRSYEKQ